MIITKPPQCNAYRPITWWEKLKQKWFGRTLGLSEEQERRCIWPKSHAKFGHSSSNKAKHQDTLGNRWKVGEKYLEDTYNR
jgi:hypothetical protein